MLNTRTKAILASAIALALPAYVIADDHVLSEPPIMVAAYENMHGRVTAIDLVHDKGSSSGTGAVVGGVLGGVLGHQVGNGRGNTAATVAGAIGGAVVGNEVEKERKSSDFYHVSIHFRDGRDATYRLNTVGDLRVGDLVRVDGEGRIERD
jgi:outer membrane lipoprotein SlyB